MSVRIRQATLDDITGILDVEEEVWPIELRATEEQFRSRIKTFPEGTIVSLIDGTIVGVVATQIVYSKDLDHSALTWDEITDGGLIKKTHKPDGDILYGVDLSVSPFGANSASLLLQEVGRIAIRHKLKGGMLGARIPRYHKYSERMNAQDYVNFKRGERLLDPELVFYTRLGLEIIRVLPNYIKDPDSRDYGVLLGWKNPFFGKPFPQLSSWLFRIK